MNRNIILDTDSYKPSHFLQYPPNTTHTFAYVESRGGVYDQTVFVGLQYLLKEVLSKPVTLEMVDEAEEIFAAHGEPFNKQGWLRLIEKHGGYLPICIRAVPEGTVVDTHNVLVTVENTDPEFFWLTSYLETTILRAVWYPTTVATISWSIQQVIKEYLNDTADDLSGLPFKLHDFGGRGVSSYESAGIGGFAHLATGFMGTDTVPALTFARKYYGAHMAGFSIPAAEHSTITTWGRDGEVAAFKNMLAQFAKPGSILAVVSDSYDIYNAVENIWGHELKQAVIDSGATVVIRPDSGNPVDVVSKVANLLDTTFGSTINSKGYKVLNNVRIIQGDGVNIDSIRDILATLKLQEFSADNVAFGMGGALLQRLDRDTQRFAYKTSSAVVDGRQIEVYKDPITDPGKRSKRGLITLYRNRSTGELFTGKVAHGINALYEDALNTVFVNGQITKEYTLDEIRANVAR